MASAANKHMQSSLRESCNDILIIFTEFAVHNIFHSSFIFIVFILLIYLVMSYNLNNGNNK